MVTVPTYERDQVLRPNYRQGIDVQASPDDFGAAIGRGMEQAAQGAGKLSDALQAVKNLADETASRDALNGYIKAKDDATYGDGGYNTLQGKAAVDGLTDYQKKLQELRLQAQQQLTPAQQALFNKAATVVELDANRSALQHRSGELKQYVVSTAQNSIDSFKDQAVNNSSDAVQFQKYTAASLHQISDLGEKLGWSAEEISQKQKETLSDTYRLTTLKKMQADPVDAVDFVSMNKDKFTATDLMNITNQLAKPLADAAGKDAVSNVQAHGGKAGMTLDQVTDKIIDAESGGNPNAANPNSSASGLGQFTDGTWLTTIKANRPDIAAGKSDAELLVLKKDPSLGREMSLRLTEQNAATLQQAGYTPTAGNIYLAHFLGSGGAKQVLGANERKQVSDVLPASVISANPFLSGMTIADLRSWAEKKMGGDGGIVPTYSPRVAAAVNSMPANLGSQVREASHNEVGSWQTQQNAEIKAQSLQVENDFKLRMATGDTSLTQAEILNSQQIDNGTKAQLINSLSEKLKGVQQTQADIASFAAGKLVVDPYSEDGRKRVNAIWTEATKNSQQGADNRPIISGIVQQTGIVPAPVMGALRMAATSQNPKAVEQALSYSSQLRQIDPRVFDRSAGGSDVEDKAALYDHLTGTVGLSSSDATRKIMELNDPQKQADRNALLKSPDTEKWLKDTATESDARNVFYPGFFSTSFTPKLGETPAQAAAATAEYRDILQESLVDTNGDRDLAKTLAGERFKKRYGVSDYSLSGTKAITRLPPEVAYPVGIDGTWGYVGDQAKDALKKEGIAASDVYLQSDDRTNSDVKAGNPARYVLFYKDGDGFIQQYQHPFYAEPPTRAAVFEEQKKQGEAKRDANMKATDEAKARLDAFNRSDFGMPAFTAQPLPMNSPGN